MQLVAYGAQDVYLSGNPQITFFKSVYRRHTNFSMEAIEQTFNGQADFGKRVTTTISRNGDLITKMYLQVQVPDVIVPSGAAFRWLNNLGHILIKTVEVEIGGQRIDKHYGHWLYVWNELTQTAGHAIGFANMIGNTSQLTTPVENTTTGPLTLAGTTLFIPLNFWFNRNAGLALPLIALQYHEIRINLELAPVTDCYWSGLATSGSSTGAAALTAGSSALQQLKWTTAMSAVVPPGLTYASLWVDYVYLDTDERRRFAQVSHEYLVEQLQFTGEESTTTTKPNLKLSFNHPCKELIWTVQKDSVVGDGATGKQWFNYTDAVDSTYNWLAYGVGLGGAFQAGAAGALFEGPGAPLQDPNGVGSAANNVGTAPGVAAGGANGVFVPVSFEGGVNPVKLAKLQLNGHDRFAERPGRYFNLVQPYQHHENVPSCGINVYSFALKPEEHQPSGSCNMSRIDNATLNLTLTDATVAADSAKIRVYAVSYNVLRVMSGMGGLAYSN